MHTMILAALVLTCGYWQGTATTSAGPLPIAISIDQNRASLDAPLLGIVDKPLTITRLAEHLLFDVRFDDRTVSADLLQREEELTGNAKVGSETYPLALRCAQKPEKTYRTEDVTIRAGEVALAATLYLPRLAARAPGVVFVAGLAPRGDAAHFLADRFAARGIAVLTYDKRGIGASTGDPHASFASLADDAAAAVRYMRTRKEIDPARVGIRGQSQGAWIAPLAATRVPVAFVIATGGGGVQPWQSEMYAIPARMRADGFSQGEIDEATRYMKMLFAAGRSGEGWDELSAMMAELRRSGSKWFGRYGAVPPSLEYLQGTWQGEFSYDPKPALAQIRVAFLALEGERDVYSPPAETVRELQAALTTRDRTFLTIANATHDFHVAGAPLPIVSDEYVSTIVNWTAAHTGVSDERIIVEDHHVVSRDPSLTIDVDPSLKYVGTIGFDIRSAAHAERVIFVDADPDGSVRRLWIAQFERMLPGHAGAYDTKFDPVQVGRYSFDASIAAKPGGEAARTKEFLDQHGLHLAPDLLVARFEQRTDPKNRSELIVFYWEPVATAGEASLFAVKARSTFVPRAH